MPIFYFKHGGLTLRPIPHTGAATNYIFKETVNILLKRNDAVITVQKIEGQGVCLANGKHEETNKIVSLEIRNRLYCVKVEVFILNRPNINLILGLPCYQCTKPVIDFSNDLYFVQQNSKIIPLRPQEKNQEPPSLCMNTMLGSTTGKQKSLPDSCVEKNQPHTPSLV